MTDARILPVWAEDLRRRYLRGEASMFVLHGNVYDVVLCNRKMMALTEFLTDVLLKESKDTIAVYNVATGVRFTKRASNVTEVEDLLLSTEKDRVFAALERLLIGYTKTAVIMEYAEAIAPAGDPNFQGESDRAAIVTLHRWSSLPEIERGDNVVLLISENLTELAPKLISNPKVAVVEVPMPDHATRREAARLADTRLTEKDAERYAGITAGLKSIQIASILTPQPAAEEDLADREAFIVGLLGGGADAAGRAHKLATLTSGLSRDEVKELVAPSASAPAPEASPSPIERARKETDRLIAKRKREILERECFGLVEFVEPAHGFEVGRRHGGSEERPDGHCREHSRRADEPRADGHSVYWSNGNREDVCCRSLRERMWLDDDQVKEFSFEVGWRH